MAIRFKLCTPGVWMPSSPPLIYNSSTGKYEFEGVRIEDAGREETIYLGAKKTVFNLIKSAVDEELSGVLKRYRDSFVDAIASSWVTKVNMAVFSQESNQVVCSLKIDLPSDCGLEIREGGTIHYWRNGVHIAEASTALKSQMKIIIRKIYNSLSGESDTDRAVIMAKNMLIDIFNQFGVIIDDE